MHARKEKRKKGRRGTTTTTTETMAANNGGVNVCVCGAGGGIGQPLSLLLKQQLPAGSTLRLIDIVATPGVAVDLSHVSTPVAVTGHLTPMKPGEKCTDGSEDGSEAAFSGADIVVIPAGVPRKPGMTRADLFGINAGIVAGLVEKAAKFCPKAIICVITNPVNSMVPVAAEILKKAGCYDMKKVFGKGVVLLVRMFAFFVCVCFSCSL
jgi:malate dehydrogenase